MLTPRRVVMGNMYGREDSIRDLRCITPQANGCGRQITTSEILAWDDLTIREYRQSGWCDRCQDNIFKPDEDECICEWVDVGVGLMPNPMNICCPQHGDPDYFDHDNRFDYDPDMREDDPPVDMYEIEWAGVYS